MRINSKRENRRKNVRMNMDNHSINHVVESFCHVRAFTLDKPWAFTYHTRACAKGSIPNAQETQAGYRGNRGADSHAE